MNINHIQETQQTSSGISSKIFSPTHITIKLLKAKVFCTGQETVRIWIRYAEFQDKHKKAQFKKFIWD